MKIEYVTMPSGFVIAGLQWKLDGHPAYKSEIVKAGGKNAEEFLQGYNNFGKVVLDATVSSHQDKE